MKLAAAGGAFAAALALLVTLYVGARTRGLEAHCRNNLRQLGDIAWRNRNSIDPERTGRDFWQAVRESQYRDVRGKWLPIDPDPFSCPVHGSIVSKVDDLNTIDYRGPAKGRDLTKPVPQAQPLGADRPGNHPSGGFVLRLDTSVEDAPRLVERARDGDPRWAAAAAALKD
ncbi:MAG TPA: hypothetical protein VMU54_11395 [Planctomycetota bacterium]|nr:hypothetical protein [Planctomycetota bacterium]